MKKEFFSFIRTIIIALFFAGLIRSFWFEPFHIPSSSMKPNLLIGDYIIVSKYSYGYSRFSFPFGFDLFDNRIFFKNKPQRGDVIVFRYPQDVSINYVKRLIGLPGDIIQMSGGELFINNKKVEKIRNGSFTDDDQDLIIEIRQFSEFLPEGKKVEILDMYDDSSSDDTGIYRVPEGYYFFMGDNRDNSQDSRFLSYVGYVSEQNLIGKAHFIFFSVEKPVWQIWNLHKSIRLDRIFKKID